MSHSQFNFPAGVDPWQTLQPYRVEVTDQQILVHGPDVTKCQEIAQELRDKELNLVSKDKQILMEAEKDKDTNFNHITLTPGLIEPMQSVSSTPSVSSNTERQLPSISKGKKSGPSKQKTTSNEDKLKTEPANCWLQFCHFKKNEAIMKSGDKNAEYNLKDVSNEWKAMSKNERAVFIEMAAIDKKALGDNFRTGRKRHKTKEDAVVIKLPKIKNKKKKETKKTANNDKKCSEDFTDETIKFLDQLEDLDKDIEIQELKHKAMMEALMNEKVDVTKHQCKLDQVTSEVEKSTERYDQLVKKHAGCKAE